MRIHHVQYMKKKYGGSETYIDYIRAASRHSHDVGYAKGSSPVGSDESEFLRCYLDFKAYISQIPEGKYDIIHSHFFMPGFFAQQRGFTSVCSSHCLLSTEFELAAFDAKSEREAREVELASRFFRFHEEKFYPQIRNLVVYCDFHKTELEKMQASPRRMYLAFDIPQFSVSGTKEQARKDLELPERPTLLFLGRPTYLKGLHVLLGALKNLSRRKSIQLLVVGDFLKDEMGRIGYQPCIGTERNTLYEDENDNIIVRTDQARSQIPKYFAASDVLICPSFYEAGVSYVNLEAMASGVPIIASDIPGLSLVIKNRSNGLLFKPGDSEELEARVNELLGDETLRLQIAENNRKLVKKYDNKRAAEELDDFYESLNK